MKQPHPNAQIHSSAGDASEHFSQHVKLCCVMPVKWEDPNLFCPYLGMLAFHEISALHVVLAQQVTYFSFIHHKPLK